MLISTEKRVAYFSLPPLDIRSNQIFKKTFAIHFQNSLDWIYVAICEKDRSVSGIRKEYKGTFTNGGLITIELPEDLDGLEFQIFGFYQKQAVAFSVVEPADLLKMDSIELSTLIAQN